MLNVPPFYRHKFQFKDNKETCRISTKKARFRFKANMGLTHSVSFHFAPLQDVRKREILLAFSWPRKAFLDMLHGNILFFPSDSEQISIL